MGCPRATRGVPADLQHNLARRVRAGRPAESRPPVGQGPRSPDHRRVRRRRGVRCGRCRRPAWPDRHARTDRPVCRIPTSPPLGEPTAHRGHLSAIPRDEQRRPVEVYQSHRRVLPGTIEAGTGHHPAIVGDHLDLRLSWCGMNQHPVKAASGRAAANSNPFIAPAVTSSSVTHG